MEPSFVQVGLNAASGQVKIRAPDDRSAGGFLVVSMSPDAARAMAGLIKQNRTLRLCSNGRWVEHVLPAETCDKIASDLRACADAAERVY